MRQVTKLLCGSLMAIASQTAQAQSADPKPGSVSDLISGLYGGNGITLDPGIVFHSAHFASESQEQLNLAKGINALNTSTEVRQKTSELLDAVVDARFKLLEASDTQSAFLERIKELEQHIASLENWDREKERYQL